MLDERAVGRKELTLILLVAGVVVAVLITALVVSNNPQPPSKSNPAEAAARQAIDKMYQQEVAAAKAAALEKEKMRQAEVSATEELLNSFADSAPARPDDLPPEAEALTADPPAATGSTANSAPPQAPDPATPSSVRAEEGQTVSVQNIIKSVRDAGSKGEKND